MRDDTTGRPWTWSLFGKTTQDGLSLDQIGEIYGPAPENKSGKQGPIRSQGLSALADLQNIAAKEFGSVEEAKKSNLPQLFSMRQIRQRAVLLPTGDYRKMPPKTWRWVPVAHIGPGGYRLLSSTEAIASMDGNADNAPPPGDFQQEGAVGQAQEVSLAVADKVTSTLEHPVSRATLGALGVVGLAFSLWRAFS